MKNKYSRRLKRRNSKKTKRINNKKRTKRRTKKRINKRLKKQSKKRKNKGKGQSSSLVREKTWDDSEYLMAEDLTRTLSMNEMVVKTTPETMLINLINELDNDNVFINNEYVDKYVDNIEKIYTKRLDFMPHNYSKFKKQNKTVKRKYESELLTLIKNEGLIGSDRPFHMGNINSSSSSSSGGKRKRIYNGGFIAGLADAVSGSAAQVALTADFMGKVAKGEHMGNPEESDVEVNNDDGDGDVNNDGGEVNDDGGEVNDDD